MARSIQFVLAVALCGSSCAHKVLDDRLVYEKRAGLVYDAGYVIDQAKFDESYLTKLSEKVLQRESVNCRLIRLTFGSSERWLGLGLPMGDYSYQTPARYNDEAKVSRIAQVTYFSGSGVLTLKLGKSTLTRQLMGGVRRPWLLAFGSGDAMLSSFHLGSHGHAINFYLTAEPLPSPDQWDAMYQELRRDSGLSEMRVIVRPDDLFGELGGNVFDVFHFPYPAVPLQVYDKRKYLACITNRDNEKAKKEQLSCGYHTNLEWRPYKTD